MPRLADIRLPAEPSSALQRAKYERMLQAATELGAVYDFDHVQMHEVARRAGVAIATLYRYFPSKTHLFVNVMLSEIAKMSHNLERRNGRLAELGPIESATDALIRALRALHRHPRVASSMIYAANAAHVSRLSGVQRVDNSFEAVLLASTHVQEPTEHDVVVLRLLQQQWFAIVQSCLSGLVTLQRAEFDVRVACELLLMPLSSVQRESSVE